jgi:hypothetical protein
MHSAVTGVQVSVTRTPDHAHYLLIDSSLLGFTYCDGRERESDRSIIFWWLLGYFFAGVLYCDNRERVFIFDSDTKENEQSDLCSFYWYNISSIYDNRNFLYNWLSRRVKHHILYWSCRLEFICYIENADWKSYVILKMPTENYMFYWKCWLELLYVIIIFL